MEEHFGTGKTRSGRHCWKERRKEERKAEGRRKDVWLGARR